MTQLDSLPAMLMNYVWDRLDLPKGQDLSVSSIAEDWFVEDALASGSPFVWRGRDPESSLRLLYRYVRQQNLVKAVEDGVYLREPALLLLHQMTELLPAIFGAAAANFQLAGEHR